MFTLLCSSSYSKCVLDHFSHFCKKKKKNTSFQLDSPSLHVRGSEMTWQMHFIQCKSMLSLSHQQPEFFFTIKRKPSDSIGTWPLPFLWCRKWLIVYIRSTRGWLWGPLGSTVDLLAQSLGRYPSMALIVYPCEVSPGNNGTQLDLCGSHSSSTPLNASVPLWGGAPVNRGPATIEWHRRTHAHSFHALLSKSPWHEVLLGMGGRALEGGERKNWGEKEWGNRDFVTVISRLSAEPYY